MFVAIGSSQAFAVEGEHIFSNVKLSSKNIYTDSDYQFAINYPNNWEVVPYAAAIQEDYSFLVSFYEKSSDIYQSNFGVFYQPLQKTDYDSGRNDFSEQELLDATILGLSESTKNFKLIDSKIKTYDDGIKLEYTYLRSVRLSDMTDLDSDANTFLSLKQKSVQFMTENSLYSINFASMKENYSSGISNFDISVNSFVSGDYKKILDDAKKITDDKKIADKKIADKKIADKKIADKKIADKKIADKKIADKKIADKKAADKKIADKKAADKKLADKKLADKKLAEMKAAGKLFDLNSKTCKTINGVWEGTRASLSELKASETKGYCYISGDSKLRSNQIMNIPLDVKLVYEYKFTNSGTITNSGLISAIIFENYGTITTNGEGTIMNFGKFLNNESGKIIMNNKNSIGFFNDEDGLIDNRGIITINTINDNWVYGIWNKGHIENSVSSKIIINNVEGYGIFNDEDYSFTYDGIICGISTNAFNPPMKIDKCK